MDKEKKELRSVQIDINQAIVDRMKRERIVADTMGTALMVLVALFDGNIGLLDYADDSNKERRMNILYRDLLKKDLVEEDAVGAIHYKLTARGNELATYIKEQQTTPRKVLVAEIVEDVAVETSQESCEYWIEEYVNIFPKVDKGERIIRMHHHTAVNKMNTFMKHFGYNKETILAATRLYVDEQSNQPDGIKYMSNSSNFISKNPSRYSNYESPLAAWCKRWLDEQSGEGKQHFNTNILDMV